MGTETQKGSGRESQSVLEYPPPSEGYALSFLKKLLGAADAAQKRGVDADTQTVRRIASELDRLPVETARYLAAFAYVLARVAHADLEIDDSEVREIERIVKSIASLSEAETALVVQIAKSQAVLLGGTENYVVTREFRRISTPEQRSRLLQCLFAVAAADDSISGDESVEIAAIGDELGFTRAEINSLRGAYRDKLAIFQNT
jgi:uncharacterized tellurite resistance protein B-like protein